jgi:ribonuclease D
LGEGYGKFEGVRLSFMGPAGRITWRYLSDPAQIAEAVEALRREPVIGLDTETYWDAKTNGSYVSLAQLAGREGDVIVADVMSAGIEPLRPLLEAPKVRMVAHNARFDEAMLRGAGVKAYGLIDTLRMSRMALSLDSHSLASVCEHLLGLPMDKSLQRSNWRRRPLTRAQIEYAALDARIAILVYDELSRVLSEKGILDAVLRESVVEPREASAEASKSPRRRKALPRPEIVLTPEEKLIVVRLKRWRMERANTQRVPAYMICPDRTLEQLARELPETLEALANVYGLGESKISKFGEELLKALRDACA